MTKIEWTRNQDGTPGKTWNPVLGCSLASPGCDRCYAATFAHRGLTEAHKGLTAVGEHGPEFNGTIRLLPERLDQPLRWAKPATVFVCSMSDLFHHKVPDDFIARVWATMGLAGRHTFQVLTKRPQRLAEVVGDPDWRDYVDRVVGTPIDARTTPIRWLEQGAIANVWAGTSIESDRYAWRADHLRRTPAAVRFLSLEPLLGPLPSLDFTGIDWVIIGGESGHGARRMELEWVDDIITRARQAGAAVFVKQLGAHYRQPGDPKAGKLESIPPEFRVREMPAGVAR